VGLADAVGSVRTKPATLPPAPGSRRTHVEDLARNAGAGENAHRLVAEVVAVVLEEVVSVDGKPRRDLSEASLESSFGNRCRPEGNDLRGPHAVVRVDLLWGQHLDATSVEVPTAEMMDLEGPSTGAIRPSSGDPLSAEDHDSSMPDSFDVFPKKRYGHARRHALGQVVQVQGHVRLRSRRAWIRNARRGRGIKNKP